MAATAMKGPDSKLLLLPAALAFVLLSLAAAALPAEPGLVFHVGGQRLPDANTSYGWWAMSNRFHVGYELSELQVRERLGAPRRPGGVRRLQRDGAPLERFADGSTAVRLDRSGFFCFISGDPGHCEEGQRLIVRVMVHPAEHAAAPGQAYAPPASQPGHGGGGGSGSGSGSGGRPRPSGWPGTSSCAATVAAGVALAAAMAVLSSLVLMLQ